MSIHDLAQHVQAHGRGNDTRLMHVTPKELGSLRALAQSRGGDLTTNPHTGLPEAGFLDSMLPTLVGAGVGIATGNPLIGAAVGGGLATATSGGNLQAGLMAGLGSYGFGSLGAGLAEAGGSALAAESTPAAIDAGANIAGQTANGIGANAWSSDASLATNASAPSAVPGYTPAEGSLRGVSAEMPAPSTAQDPSTWDKLTKGFQTTKFDSNWLKQNMFPLGLGAAGLLLGNQSTSGTSTNPVTTQQTPYVRPYTYNKTVNPNWGQPGQPYFNQQAMVPGTPIAASDTVGQTFFAEGGIAGLEGNQAYPMSQQDKTQYATPSQLPASAVVMNSDYDARTDPYTGAEVVQRMASGGQPNQAVIDYNNQLMQRAQQEYLNTPPPAPMMPRSAGLPAGIPRAPNLTPVQPAAAATAAQPAAPVQSTDPQAPPQQGMIPMSWHLGPNNAQIVDTWGFGGSGNNGSGGSDGVGAGGSNGGVGSSSAGGDGPGGGWAGGGMMHQGLGAYSDGGRLLKGPGDGVSDSIPAQIGGHQPARLADGEFVVPARIVSELGNGSTDAGARRLYAMMDRIQQGRKKSVGNGKVAVDSKAERHLPA